MSCRPTCSLCEKLIISQAVSFTNNTLEINLPAGSYAAGEKYCIVVAQAIPAATTITAPVYITIGDGEDTYPLVNACCAQVIACSIRTRTKCSTRVITNAAGGTFKLLGKVACAPNTAASYLDGGAVATTT